MITIADHILEPTFFPDRTSQVWKLPEEVLRKRYVLVKWEFDHEGEFMHLAQVKRLLDHAGVDCNLSIPFLPYGRQDKELLNDQCGALRVFAEVLNILGFNKIFTLDPHSHVAVKLINNLHVTWPNTTIHNAIGLTHPDLICFPDMGAQMRYCDLFAGIDTITIEKERDQSTGKIIGMELGDVAQVKTKGQNILIIDDICDGGATFEKASRLLKSFGANAIYLCTTHGIYSKGLRGMEEAGISRFFCRKGEVTQSRSSHPAMYTIMHTPFQEES
jgi:ribose-phosphate pyrophosphokinase